MIKGSVFQEEMAVLTVCVPILFLPGHLVRGDDFTNVYNGGVVSEANLHGEITT